ncbi:MAG: SIR2 family protein [Niabella sp.]
MLNHNFSKLLSELVAGEVILFAGSGLSQYAGYPNAYQLGNRLLSILSEQEQLESGLNVNSDLMDIANVVEAIKDRNLIINSINEIFGRSTITKFDTHELIARIYFIKDIITTNYDYLFEAAYGDNIHTIVTDEHLGATNSKKVNLFKIHGDPDHPESIILTRDDYARFARKNSNSIILSALQEKFATKTTIFVGYSLQDLNVRGEFFHVVEKLGSNFKQGYFVSPDLNKANQSLLAKKGLTYLNYRGEDFFKLLFDHICKDLIQFSIDNIADLSLTERFLKGRDVYVNYDTSKGNKTITGAGSLSGTGEEKVQLTFTGEDIHKQMKELLNGRHTRKVSIPAKNIVKASTIINGINIPLFKDGASIELIQLPSKKGTFDIRFKDGFELNDLNYEIYRSDPFIEISVTTKAGKFMVSHDLSKPSTNGFYINLNFTHNKLCSNTVEEINSFQLLANFANGVPFTIFSKGKSSEYSHTTKREVADNAIKMLTHFRNLNFIEKRFGVKFRDLPYIDQSNDNIDIVQRLTDRLGTKGQQIMQPGMLAGLTFTEASFYKPENLEKFFALKDFERHLDGATFYNLFNHEINVGQTYLKIVNAEFKNKEDVLTGKNERIEFSCDEFWISYISPEEVKLRAQSYPV